MSNSVLCNRQDDLQVMLDSGRTKQVRERDKEEATSEQKRLSVTTNSTWALSRAKKQMPNRVTSYLAG